MVARVGRHRVAHRGAADPGRARRARAQRAAAGARTSRSVRLLAGDSHHHAGRTRGRPRASWRRRLDVWSVAARAGVARGRLRPVVPPGAVVVARCSGCAAPRTRPVRVGRRRPRAPHSRARLRVSRAVRVVQSAAVQVPAVVGWLRPVDPAAGQRAHRPEPAAARRHPRARARARAAARLRREPAADGGRGPALLSPGLLVDLAPRARGARAVLRRHRGVALRRSRALRHGAGRSRSAARRADAGAGRHRRPAAAAGPPSALAVAGRSARARPHRGTRAGGAPGARHDRRHAHGRGGAPARRRRTRPRRATARCPPGTAWSAGRSWTRSRDAPSPAPATKSPAPRTRRSGTTDDDGRFETRPIKAGTYTMSARAKGYVMGWYGPRESPFGAPIDVRAGRVSSGIEIRLQASGAINGRILDEHGNGLQGVEIVLEPAERSADRRPAARGRLRTDHRERASIASPPRRATTTCAPTSASRCRRPKGPRRPTYVSTFYPGRAREGRGPAAAHRGRSRPLRHRLHAGHRQPRARAGPRRRPERRQRRGAPRRRDEHEQRARAASGSSRSAIDAEGRFEIRDLVPGDYMINVWDQRRTNRWVAAMKHPDARRRRGRSRDARLDRRARRRAHRARSVEHRGDRFHRGTRHVRDDG